MNVAFDAILACRLKGTRLYGKPLQLLDIERGLSILESGAQYLKSVRQIRKVCLAISDEPENAGFVDVAKKHGWDYIFGHPQDVLGRILQAGEKMGTSHVLRFTSECPFIAYERIDEVFSEHLSAKADYSAIEGLPEGSSFEVISLHALKTSHQQGTDRNRSELVTSYIFENQSHFKILRPTPEPGMNRSEVRITVDYPEDLIFCRKLYKDLNGRERLIPVREIIQYWDQNPEVRKIVEEIGVDWGTGRLWK